MITGQESEARRPCPEATVQFLRFLSRLRRPGARLVAGALLLAGCVNQNKEVALYRNELDGPNPPAVDEFYEGKPLSLQEALLLANRRDENLAITGETYVQALIDKERAFSAFLPTLSLAPAVNYINPARAAGGKTWLYDVPVTGNINLFNGFQDVANLRRAGYTAEQRQALLLDLQMTLFLNVSQTYYSVISNERSVQVLINSAKVQSERVRNQQAQLTVGLSRPLDVAQSEAQASATRVSLITAQNNVRNSRIMLAFLTNAPVENAVLIDRLDVPRELFPMEEALTVAQQNRQDVVAARRSVESARQLVSEALGQWYPSVSLNVEYFLRRQDIPGAAVWNGILSANVPIFTAGIVHANVRTAWSQLRQARLSQLATLRTVDEQVKTAYENLQQSTRRLKEERVEVAAARDALLQAQQSYQVGLATNLDVLTAQDQLLTSQLSLVAEEINNKVYYLNLLRTMGRLTRPRGIPASDVPASSTLSDLELSSPSVPPPGQSVPGRGAGIQPATLPAGNDGLPSTLPEGPRVPPPASTEPASTSVPRVPELPIPTTNPSGQ